MRHGLSSKFFDGVMSRQNQLSKFSDMKFLLDWKKFSFNNNNKNNDNNNNNNNNNNNKSGCVR